MVHVKIILGERNQIILTISESMVTVFSIPEPKTYISTIIGRYAAAVNDNAENDESKNGKNLDYA